MHRQVVDDADEVPQRELGLVNLDLRDARQPLAD
jgi:hypothetical protein